MDGFEPMNSFGPDVARRYAGLRLGDEDETVDVLADLARADIEGTGRVLELAIGTGRIAIPLIERGVEVDGIEQSAAMTAVLHESHPDVRVTHGDMASADAPGTAYALVFLVFNTIGNLLTQDDQVRCFENAARHLAPGGAFVVEMAMPSAWLDGRTQFVDVERVATDTVVLDVNHYDPVTQMLAENHVTLSPAGIDFGPIAQRVPFPSELDLMARIAGLRLRDRWGGWRGEPFTAHSRRHVSVYERR